MTNDDKAGGGGYHWGGLSIVKKTVEEMNYHLLNAIFPGSRNL